jgi:hypothetical protein
LAQVSLAEARRSPRGHGVRAFSPSLSQRLLFFHVDARYVLLDGWKPESKYHQELMALHLRGNGCAKTPTIAEDLQFFKKVREMRIQSPLDFLRSRRPREGRLRRKRTL